VFYMCDSTFFKEESNLKYIEHPNTNLNLIVICVIKVCSIYYKAVG
jgi:hypothetical protein